MQSNLGVLVGAVVAAPAEARLDADGGGRRGQEQGNGERMHAEIEQGTTVPLVRQEVAPTRARIHDTHFEMVERSERGNGGAHGRDGGGVRQVLGIEQPVAVRFRGGDQRVGLRQGRAQRFLHDHGDTGREQ